MNQPLRQDTEELHLIIRDDRIWNSAVAALHRIKGMPTLYEMILRPFEKTRSLPQNSRYWASLTEYLNQMNQTVHVIANETGYSALEVKRLIAAEMPAEHIAILFARKPEAAHEVLKVIHNIPTSTRLGTKKFMLFEERMIQTIAEIAGQVNAFARRAA
jgi:hypothetical protein